VHFDPAQYLLIKASIGSYSTEMMRRLEKRSVERKWKSSLCASGTLMLGKGSMMNSGTTCRTATATFECEHVFKVHCSRLTDLWPTA
jgi:hypothetical protein